MSKKVEVGGSAEIPEVDDGTYEGVLKNIEELTSVFREGNRTIVPEEEVGERDEVERDLWGWNVEVETGEEEPPVLRALSSRTFTTRSKSYKWYSAFIGEKPSEGEQVDIDDAVDKKALITVENQDRGGTKFPTVTDIVPLPKKTGGKSGKKEKKK